MKDPIKDGEQRVLAGPAQAQAGEGHAHLRHRLQPLRLRQQVERGLRARAPLLGHLAQARMTHRKQGHFRAGKESVDGDQQDHQDEAESEVRFTHGRPWTSVSIVTVCRTTTDAWSRFLEGFSQKADNQREFDASSLVSPLQRRAHVSPSPKQRPPPLPDSGMSYRLHPFLPGSATFFQRACDRATHFFQLGGSASSLIHNPPTTERAWKPRCLAFCVQYQSLSGTRLGDSLAKR